MDTRPLGASIADWLGKPVHGGDKGAGLGYGDATVALVALSLLVAALVWLRSTGHDQPRSPELTP